MYIGQPLDRRDGDLKAMGAARYAAEFAVPGVVHAVLVQSTVPAGTITSFDLSQAESMPGVLAIITPQNAPALTMKKMTSQTVTRPMLQDMTVLYNGAHVALVVADTLERAQEAAARVRVHYSGGGNPDTVMDQALGRAYKPKDFRGGSRSPDSQRGDPDGAFAGAAVKIDATYTTPVEHHNPMEPHATIAAWEGERLTVWTSTQSIHNTQETLGGMFGIDPKNVLVRSPFVGGGFGSKGNTWPPVTLAALAARVVERPVKLVLDRAQMYTSNGYRPRTIQHLKLGAERNGKLVAARHDTLSQMSQPVLGEFTEPCGLATEMLYACPNLGVTHRLVPVNQGFPTFMRAPGESSGVFALESAMDELAVALQMDPVALRLANYADTDPHENKPFSSKKLRECYTEGAAAFGWDRRMPQPRSMRDGHWLVGMGMATATYPNNRRPAHARVILNADGSAVIQSGTQDIGTGTWTIMAQAAADELGVPYARMRSELGDSRLPVAPGSGGSSTVPSVMPAIQAACQALKQKLFALAVQDGRAGTDATQMRFADSIISGPAGKIPLADLLARNKRRMIDAEVESKPGEERKHYSLHAFGAQFAEVRVDADTGEIRLMRFVGVFDAGRVMNAKTAHSQLIGGITYGIGMALFEETEVDAATGRIVNANLAEYLVPVHADVPPIDARLVPNDDLIGNPMGVKGVGELPMVGAAAAIANAVWHATGVRVRDLPIRMEDLLT